jgi:hypothetical protein
MDNREAKFILSAYRPGGQDADDPRFAEALGQTRDDPVLEHWFRDAVAFDTHVAEKLQSLPPPSDLRQSILAGIRMSDATQWQFRFLHWAIAATLIVAAIFGMFVLRERAQTRLSDWQVRTLAAVSSLVEGKTTFDARSPNAAELIQWLRDNRAPAADRLPRPLETLTTIGCKTFFWNDKPVSVICFAGQDGSVVHLIVTDRAVDARKAIGTKPSVVQQGKWATLSWREGDKLYMLALEGAGEQLRKYL